MAERRASRWILVAENQQTLRDSWCDALEHLGYHTIEAADECEALDLIRKTVPDLILLNAGLLHSGPRKGPKERDLLCRAIEASIPTAIPVLIIADTAEVETRIPRLQIVGHLRSSAELSTMLETVRTALSTPPRDQ